MRTKTISYEAAIIALSDYMAWVNGDGKHPGKDQMNAALTLAITTMRQVVNGEIPTSPQNMRFDALAEMINAYVQENISPIVNRKS